MRIEITEIEHHPHFRRVGGGQEEDLVEFLKSPPTVTRSLR
jgi:hypothetical protein